ncbi:MAG: PorT family protein [Proteobacteria bacterium]|nr:PorT family protein [Pseudomonadota bacterium]
MDKDENGVPWSQIKKNLKSKLNKLSEESVSSLKDNIESASEKVRSVYHSAKEQATKELDGFKATLSHASKPKPIKRKKIVLKNKGNHKMNKSLLIVLSTCVFLAGTTTSFSEEESKLLVGLAGVATLQKPYFVRNNAGTKVYGEKSYGMGATAEFSLKDKMGLEADVLYLSHKFRQDSAEFFGTNVSNTFSSGYIHIPVLLRYKPLSFINIGLGGYYSRVVTTWRVSAGGYNKTSTNYGRDDFGIATALGTAIPINDLLSFNADLRYTRSLSKTARSSGDALRFSEFQVLAGLKIALL